MKKTSVYIAMGIFLSLLSGIFSCSFTNSFSHAAGQTSDTCQMVPTNRIPANGDIRFHHSAYDNNRTYLSNFDEGSTIQMGAGMTICSVNIAWFNGNYRQNNLVIPVSSNGTAFLNVFSGTSRGTTKLPERYSSPADIVGRFVRFDSNGNIHKMSASITELALNGPSSTSPQPPPASQPTTGILLAFYMYPQVWILGNTYEQLANIARAHPSVGITAIINPDSGPGTAQNIDYIQGISILKNAGIRVIGYVYTSYASRPIADVEADIDRYVSFYGSSISGILFDEMSYTGGNENYYKTLSNYAKSKGLTFTAGNPGTDTLPSYIGTVDTLNIYEGSGVPSLGYLSGGWHSNYSKQNFSFVAYGVPNLNQTYITSAAKYVGYMYITNDNLPNPWDNLPPYLEQLVTILGGNTTTTAPQDHSTFGFYFGSPITNATHVTALNKLTKQHNNTASYTPKTTTKK